MTCYHIWLCWVSVSMQHRLHSITFNISRSILRCGFCFSMFSFWWVCYNAADAKIYIIVEIKLKDYCIFSIINTTKWSELQSTKVHNPLRGEERGWVGGAETSLRRWQDANLDYIFLGYLIQWPRGESVKPGLSIERGVGGLGRFLSINLC